MIRTVPRSPFVLAALAGALLLAGAASAGDSSPFVGEVQPIEPTFAVEIGGVDAGYFRGVEGLSAELELIEDQDGGIATRARVTLRRPYIEGSELFRWFSGAQRDPVAKSLVVEVEGEKGNSVRVWNLQDALPMKYHIDVATDLSGNAVAIEELVVAGEGFELAR